MKDAPGRRMWRWAVLSVSTLSAIITMACGGRDSATDPDPVDPDPDTATVGTPDTMGHVTVDSFFSTALGITKPYLVYLPPSYATSKTRRYPVAYFLHGAFSGERSWIDDVHLDKALDSLVKADSNEMIVVMPDGDLSFFHTWVAPPTYESCLARGTIYGEPAAKYCVPTMRYDSYIADDLVRQIDGKYRTLANKKNRGIAGLSMGGGGAVYLTLTRPDVFGAAASLSGGVLALLNVGTPDHPVTATDTTQLRIFHDFFWIDFSMPQQFGGNLNDWRKYDPTSIAETVAVPSVAPLWFIVGTFDAPSLPGNRTLHNALVRRGITHIYKEVTGSHDFAFWIAHAGEAAGWLGKQIKQ